MEKKFYDNAHNGGLTFSPQYEQKISHCKKDCSIKILKFILVVFGCNDTSRMHFLSPSDKKTLF